MLRATWRGLETWHGRDASANWRASPRPYRESRSSFFNRAAGVKKVFPLRFRENSASTLEASYWRSVVSLLA
jgi:hypothetical protein